MDASHAANNNYVYASYQPEYDAEYNPQWHTNDSPSRNSLGQLMECTGDVRDSAPRPTIATVPAPVQEIQVLNEFDQLEWSTCDFDSAGSPVGYSGKLWSQYAVVKLGTICSKLQVYGVKNACKDHIMDAIVNTYNNKQAYSTMKEMVNNQQANGGASSTRKEVQCPYRLLNILFSDDFAEEFANIGNTASRHAFGCR
jgi:hypothetical protein